MTEAAAEIAIDVKGLSKSFDGREVVHDLSMQVKRGSIYGFLGPNGSGKTTTIRMLCGLLTPDSGEGTCLGFDIRRDVSKSIAFGAGPHFCAGAWASRAMIADVALPTLFRRLNNLRLRDDEPVRIGGWAFRGLLNLPVKWEATQD